MTRCRAPPTPHPLPPTPPLFPRSHAPYSARSIHACAWAAACWRPRPRALLSLSCWRPRPRVILSLAVLLQQELDNGGHSLGGEKGDAGGAHAARTLPGYRCFCS